ncbi:hypothetical protein ACQ4M3_35765 [Leptolyngbya sp. AN03gr2]|uniref:hypothetical protein n=1 Tax=unclassified Leptolyngbya TaxID=2650499 RepID=UPI003D323D1B
MVATTRKSRTRNAYAHLTDPARLKHVYNTLAKAISAAPVGELSSWEDVKAHVEQFSQATGKAPIGMELCERDGEVCGFRFYLQQYPDERTSGSYLVKNLKAAGIDLPVEDHYFTPSSLSAVLGLEQSDTLDEDIGLEDDELSGIDETLSSVGLIDEAITPQRTQTGNQSRSQQGSAVQPRMRSPDSVTANVLDTANYASQELARSNGAGIDGINLTGGTSQFATSAAAVAFALMKTLENPDGRYRSRLKRLANFATQQANRLDQLFDRAEDLEVTTEPAEVPENPPEIAEPFTEATNVLACQTNKLSKNLDSSLEALQPLKLNRQAKIDQQLNQIEEYLQQLSQRLDQLEAMMTRLEQQVTEQSEVIAAFQKEQNSGLDVLDALVDEQPTVDHTIALRMIESFQQQVQFGDRALTVAWTDGEGQPKYEFDVTERQADGTQSMIGYSARSRELVFAAVLSENTSPQINHCSIPASEIESLAQDLAPEAPEQPEPIRPQRQRQLNRQRLPEL